MTERLGRRPFALAGLLSLVLGLIGTAVSSGPPGFVSDPAGIAAYLKDDSEAVLASHTMYLLSAVLVLWFAGGMYATLRSAERPHGHTAIVALAGAVAGVSMMLAAAAAGAVGALRADENDGIAPEVAAALWDLSSILYGLAAPMAMAVFVLAVAVATLRTAALPRWLGILSVPLGVALLIPPINFLAMIAFQVWVAIAAVALLLHRAPGAHTASAPE